MILTKCRWLGLFTLFLLVFLSNQMFSLRFPEIFFFPMTPNYQFSLVSDKGNSLDAAISKIEFTDIEDQEMLFLDWSIKWKMNHQNFFYKIRLKVMMNGDIYLCSIDDNSFSRSFEEETLLFPAMIAYNQPIYIGENMEVKYVKSLPNYKINDKVWNDIVVMEANFSGVIYSIYFSKNSGIIAIKSDNEFYKSNG